MLATLPGEQAELPGEPPNLAQICPVCYHDPYGPVTGVDLPAG